MIDFAKKTQELRDKKALEQQRDNMPEGQIMLTDGRIITLNDQQSGGLVRMKDWTDSPLMTLTLSGYAGTGKTTLTQELIRKCKFAKHDIAVSAPTHKAKKVIARATRMDAYTIQKLLGLRPNVDLENFDINDPQFDPLAEKSIRFYKLLILDEASMLNEGLFELLLSEAKSWGCKILFMGDPAQLPPVGEHLSRVFKDVDVIVELTQVERQSGSNPLMGVYDAIRSDIGSPQDMFNHSTQLNDKGEGIQFYHCLEAFKAEVLPMFTSQEYKANPDHIKLVTWMNESVKLWNKHIRDYVYSNPTLPLIAGEVLMAYSNVTDGPEEIILENAAEYHVLEIEDAVSEGIDCYFVKIKEVDGHKITRTHIVKRSGIPVFVSRHQYLLSLAKASVGKARRFAWGNYYQFKKSHLLMEDVTDNGKLVVRKDLDYAYAITVHKSQGSTFTNVAISENNIDRNGKSEERNKLKYVALSRPTTRAIVLSSKTSEA